MISRVLFFLSPPCSFKFITLILSVTLMNPDGFGSAVAVSGDWMAIGAPQDGSGGSFPNYPSSKNRYLCFEVTFPKAGCMFTCEQTTRGSCTLDYCLWSQPPLSEHPCPFSPHHFSVRNFCSICLDRICRLCRQSEDPRPAPPVKCTISSYSTARGSSTNSSPALP
jgi:hypothetical protein